METISKLHTQKRKNGTRRIATQQQAIEKLTDENDSMKASVREHLRKYQQHEKVRE